MDTDRLLSAGMAVVVIAAVGFSASTLAASMSTNPSDAVDVQWDTLPLGEDSQGDIEAAAADVDERYRQGGDGDADGQGDSGDAQRQDSQAGDGQSRDQQADEAGDGEPREVGVGDSDEIQQGGQSDSLGGTGLVPGGPPLSLVLWLALLVALLLLAYRYRDRLRRAIGRGADGPAAESLAPAPENEVERAWVELVARAGVDRPRTRTPRDCARQAVETGFDPSHVDRLRRTFEDVRYGTTTPTDEQARLARETLASLDGERA